VWVVEGARDDQTVCCEGLLGDDRTVSVWVGWGRRRVGSLGMCGGTGQCQCVCMGGEG
jgi:hypothetical protein